MDFPCREYLRDRLCTIASLAIVSVLVCPRSSIAQDSNSYRWNVQYGDGNWSVATNWDPNGPPDGNYSAVIGQAVCIVDLNNTTAGCYKLYLGGGELKQSGGLLVIEANAYVGYGNNSGTFSQGDADGTTFIHGSLFIGLGLNPSPSNGSGTFQAERGTVVVSGDIWVGDPNRERNSASLLIERLPDGNKAVLKAGGDIHVCQMPTYMGSPSSAAWFSGEVGPLDPNRPLSIFNDGALTFGQSQNTYNLGRIVSADPNSVGYCMIEGNTVVAVHQVCQVWVDIGPGGLMVSGTPEYYESNIVDGIENHSGDFRVADAKVAMGFLTTFSQGGYQTGGDGGRVWVDSNGIVSVTYIHQSSLTICPTGQFFVSGQTAYFTRDSEDPLLAQPMKVLNVESDGNLHLSNCWLSADSIRGVGGGVGGWTIADSNVVLTITNNLEQAFVTVLASSQVTVNNGGGYYESNVVDGIESEGNVVISHGVVYAPFVESISGLPAGRIWLDNDSNLVTGRVLQESVYISDNATLTLVDGGITEEPNLRTNVYNRGLVHVVSGTHVLGKIVPPEPNVCLGAIIVEPGAALYTTGFRADSVWVGDGALLSITGNIDGSPTTSQVNNLYIAGDWDPNDPERGMQDSGESRTRRPDANWLFPALDPNLRFPVFDPNYRSLRLDPNTRRVPLDTSLLPGALRNPVFPALDPNLRFPLFDPNYLPVLRDPNMRDVPLDPNCFAPPGPIRRRQVQNLYWVMTRPATLHPKPVFRGSPLAIATNQSPRRRAQYPPPDEAASRAASSTLVILGLGTLVLLAIWHPRLHGSGNPSPRRKPGRARSAPGRHRRDERHRGRHGGQG